MKRLAVVLLVLAGFGWLSVQLGQDTNWDLKNYHFYNPYAWVQDRIEYDIQPAQLQSYLNPLTDAPFYWMVQHLRPVSVGFWLGAAHGLNFWLLFLIAREVLRPVQLRGKPWLSALLALAGVLGPVGLYELGTSITDISSATPLFAALWLTLRSARTTGRTALLLNLAAGLLVGTAVGLKLTMLTYALGWAVVLVVSRPNWRSRLTNLTSAAIGAGIAVGATTGFWWIRMWQQFGNPVFPFFNGMFKSPYYPAVNFSDVRYFAEHWWEWLLKPFYLASPLDISMEYRFADVRASLVFVAALVALAVVLWRWLKNRRQKLTTDQQHPQRVTKLLLIFVGVSYVLWLYQFSYNRYFFVLEGLLPLTLCVLLLIILRRPFASGLVSAGLVTIMLITTQYPPLQRTPWAPTFFEVAVDTSNLPTQESLVLMMGGEPTAYLIPFLSQHYRYVRVESNMSDPGDGLQTQLNIEALLKAHQGPLLALIHPLDDPAVLAYYGLEIDKTACTNVDSQLEPAPLQLCTVNR